jgi:menaquinone-dependent protoporphyrinogen oxidase
MSHVLVAYATKHGRTAEIAHAIGDSLRETGATAEVCEASTVRELAGFHTLVVGSALYAGRWRGEAVVLLERIAREGGDRPVWLFQSGPLGGAPDDAAQPLPDKVRRLADRIGVRHVATFGGALLPGTPGIIERLMLRSLSGDFRDWASIRAWARTVASELPETATPAVEAQPSAIAVAG